MEKPNLFLLTFPFSLTLSMVQHSGTFIQLVNDSNIYYFKKKREKCHVLIIQHDMHNNVKRCKHNNFCIYFFFSTFFFSFSINLQTKYLLILAVCLRYYDHSLITYIILSFLLIFKQHKLLVNSSTSSDFLFAFV